MHENGRLYTAQELKDNFDLDLMTANSVISSIPRNWKHRLKNLKSVSQDTSIYFLLSKRKCIDKVRCKEVYDYHIQKLTELPTSCKTWCRLSRTDFDSTHWQFYFNNIKAMSFRQHSQMFQYKLLHRILNVNTYLKKMSNIRIKFMQFLWDRRIY